MSTGRNQILVIRGGAIGDFILTLPVLTALRRQFPQARIEVLGYPHIVQLALAGGLADAVRSIEAAALAGFFARGGKLDESLRDYFDSFALIISYLYDPDRIFQENLGRCSRAQFVAGPHRPDEVESLHATQVLLRPLEQLAIYDADPIPRLSIGLRQPALSQLALHPGSGSERKNWPETKWSELLEQLVRVSPLDLLLVGGEAEGGRLQRLAGCLPPNRVRVAQGLPLVELARQLTPCAGFVGHDSGISHLAAALGVPSLVLWGETAAAVWRPRGDHVSVVSEAKGLGSLTARRVATELSHWSFHDKVR